MGPVKDAAEQNSNNEARKNRAEVEVTWYPGFGRMGTLQQLRLTCSEGKTDS